MILDLCNSLGITLSDRDIERAHRLGFSGPKDRPILVKFHHFGTRQLVWKKRNIFKSKDILVLEDFPSEVLQRRRVFSPVIKAAYASQGQYKAKLNVDKLIVNGIQYTTKDLHKLPDELHPSVLTTVKRGNIIAFFSRSSMLSNHYPAPFVKDGVQFHTSEQYLMFKKAKHFNDEVTAAAILSSKDPVHAKQLGKKVSNFCSSDWNKVRDAHMLTALEQKFRQNDTLATFLKSTGMSTLVEANPKDQYWGAGVPLDHDDIWDCNKWNGRNRLGELLQEIRQSIK